MSMPSTISGSGCKICRCPPGTCCNSGCECWNPEYDISFAGPIDLGTYKKCDCCGRCVGEDCENEGDCCFEEEFSVVGISGRLYRTGNDSFCDSPFASMRTCPDPWVPPTRTLEVLGADCNTYETDSGLCPPGSSVCRPCPDAEPEATAEMSFEYYVQVDGGACEDCTNAGWGNVSGGLSRFLGTVANAIDDVRIQATVPVKIELTCCSAALEDCAPCDPSTVGGSGVTHIIRVTPLAGVQFTFQNVTSTLVPPTLIFYRKLNCQNLPNDGPWQLNDRVLSPHQCDGIPDCNIPCGDYLCGCECPEDCPDPCWDIDECVGCREYREGSGSNLSLVEVER
jgi:hypothetical protein